MKSDFLLDPNITFLNHGSYGATPKKILDEQRRWRNKMEEEPVHFMVRLLPEALEQSKSVAAAFIGCNKADVCFVNNATMGVNSILMGQTFPKGSTIAYTTHRYDAVGNAIAHWASVKGWRTKAIEIPFPVHDEEEVYRCILNNVDDSISMLVLDHISSITATRFPVERIAKALSTVEHISLLVDAAHAPGQVDIDLSNIDYWTGNLHKWCCAPKGAALLYVHPKHQNKIHAPIISHGYQQGFQEEFNWMGTMDFSAFLASSTAIKEHIAWGDDSFRESNHQLAQWAKKSIIEAFPQFKASGLDDGLAMSSFIVPNGEHLYDFLWKNRIEVVVGPWKDEHILRLSAFSQYNNSKDYEKLIQILHQYDFG